MITNLLIIVEFPSNRPNSLDAVFATFDGMEMTYVGNMSNFNGFSVSSERGRKH